MRLARPIILPLIAWLACIVLLIAGLAWLSSCVSRPLPACPPLQFRGACTTQYGCGAFLDEEQLLNWARTVKGLADGTCRYVDPNAVEI